MYARRVSPLVSLTGLTAPGATQSMSMGASFGLSFITNFEKVVSAGISQGFFSSPMQLPAANFPTFRCEHYLSQIGS